MQDTTFNLFTYGPLPEGAAHQVLPGCRRIGSAQVGGTIYNIDDKFPALMLYGETEVRGEILQCDLTSMNDIDRLDSITSGTLRRIATNAIASDGSHLPCWILVAGPAIAHKLTPESRKSR